MNIPELREEIRPLIINRLISELKTKKKITLWQNLEGNRICRIASMMKVDQTGRFVKFLCPHGQNAFKFNSKEPIYFYEPQRMMIFKSTIQFQTSMEIEIRLPNQLMQQEQRIESRHIPVMDKEYTNFSLSFKENQLFHKPVLDYSSRGMSFSISRFEFQGVIIGEKIQLRHEEEARHPKDILASINSIDPLYDGFQFSTTHLRVGLVYMH